MQRCTAQQQYGERDAHDGADLPYRLVDRAADGVVGERVVEVELRATLVFDTQEFCNACDATSY